MSARFVDDPHLWATALYDEVVAMGYDRSYPMLTDTIDGDGADALGGDDGGWWVIA